MSWHWFGPVRRAVRRRRPRPPAPPAQRRRSASAVRGPPRRGAARRLSQRRPAAVTAPAAPAAQARSCRRRRGRCRVDRRASAAPRRSLKMRGELTIAACCGARAEPGSLRCGTAPSSDRRSGASSSRAAPRRAHAGRARTRRCRRSPCRSDRSPRCACASRGRSGRWRCTSGCAMSVTSKMRMPRSRSLLTGSGTPCMPQSSRPVGASPETNSRFL